jgi:hypothetical protein
MKAQPALRPWFFNKAIHVSFCLQVSAIDSGWPHVEPCPARQDDQAGPTAVFSFHAKLA